jgi:hypothetical protein
MRWPLLLLISGLAMIGFVWFNHHPSYRYKLTLTLDTPEGVRSGNNVVEVVGWEVYIPARGDAHRDYGQGLYLDLSEGRRPLIALLSHNRRAHEQPSAVLWGEHGPTGILAQRCLHFASSIDWTETILALGKCRQTYELSPAELPDLVTFNNIGDPNSLSLIDPTDLAATLGQGIRWKSMTLQIVDDPTTTEIEEHIPWMKDYGKEWVLDSSKFFRLDNIISRGNFIHIN